MEPHQKHCRQENTAAWTNQDVSFNIICLEPDQKHCHKETTVAWTHQDISLNGNYMEPHEKHCCRRVSLQLQQCMSREITLPLNNLRTSFCIL